MYSKIIKRPILTEKLAVLQERENKFAFIVNVKSNKTEIKKAIQEKFDVKVFYYQHQKDNLKTSWKKETNDCKKWWENYKNIWKKI